MCDLLVPWREEFLDDSKAFLARLEELGGVDCIVTTGGFTCPSGVPLSSGGAEKCTRGICLMTLEMPS